MIDSIRESPIDKEALLTERLKLKDAHPNSFPHRCHIWAYTMMRKHEGTWHGWDDVVGYLNANKFIYFDLLISKKTKPDWFECHSVGFTRWFESRTRDEIRELGAENVKMIRTWLY